MSKKTIFAHSANQRSICIRRKTRGYRTVQRMSKQANRLRHKAIPFSTLADLWLASIKPSVKKSTYSNYHYTIQHYLHPTLRNSDLLKITASDLEKKFFEALDTAGVSYGTPTAHAVYAVLRRIILYGVKCEMLREPSFWPKLPSCRGSESRQLTRDEQTALMALLPTKSAREFGVILTLYSGLRIGELCGLQWGDIDLKESLLCVRRSIHRIGAVSDNTAAKTAVVVDTPKTRNSFRMIPLPSFLIPYLSELRFGHAESDWFLNGSSLRPVEPRCYEKSFAAYLRRCNVPHTKFHSLRHTYATNCLQAGMDIKTLSEILGHASPTVTLNRYVHTSLEHKQNEVEKLMLPFEAKGHL